MPQTYYVAQNDQTGMYVIDINKDGLPVYSENESDAAWSFEQRLIDDYIEEHDIENVRSIAGTGGNHPPRPPMTP